MTFRRENSYVYLKRSRERGEAVDYTRFAIFRDISNSEVEAMILCFRMRRARFAPGATIRVYGGSRDVGVVVRGAAELVRFDSAGTRTILERMETGGIFGELLAFTAELGDSLEVISAGECEVLFMDYAHIMKRCEKACRYHSRLVENLFRLVAQQARRLSRRVEVLSQRSIRDKLRCYFRILCLEYGTQTVTLPFSLSTLADYISTDRSAMMRELKRMRQDGIVSMEGRRVMLLEQNDREEGKHQGIPDNLGN